MCWAKAHALQALAAHPARRLVPEGPPDISPALRVPGSPRINPYPVPEGRLNGSTPSLVPLGRRPLLPGGPGTEVPGYYQSVPPARTFPRGLGPGAKLQSLQSGQSSCCSDSNEAHIRMDL